MGPPAAGTLPRVVAALTFCQLCFSGNTVLSKASLDTGMDPGASTSELEPLLAGQLFVSGPAWPAMDIHDERSKESPLPSNFSRMREGAGADFQICTHDAVL